MVAATPMAISCSCCRHDPCDGQLWHGISVHRFNWSQGDLRPPWTPASARVRPPSTRRYRDPIRSRSSRWLHADLGWLLRTRYRLQLTPGCARRQKHHHRRSSNRKPKFKFKIAKLGKLHSLELRRLKFGPPPPASRGGQTSKHCQKRLYSIDNSSILVPTVRSCLDRKINR